MRNPELCFFKNYLAFLCRKAKIGSVLEILRDKRVIFRKELIMTSRTKNLICVVLLTITCFCSFGLAYGQDSSSSQVLINKLPDDVLFFEATSGGNVPPDS